jgi:CheY-like chemotaxis protein
VKVYLPRTQQQQQEKVQAKSPAISDGGSEAILVVEDHDQLRDFSVAALSELGYEVYEARSGHAALNLLQQNAGIALLFTDFILPEGMDGRELSQEATRRRPGLKILFTTGYARNAIIHSDRLDSGVEVLGKPYTYSGLAAKVRSILDR